MSLGRRLCPLCQRPLTPDQPRMKPYRSVDGRDLVLLSWAHRGRWQQFAPKPCTATWPKEKCTPENLVRRGAP